MKNKQKKKFVSIQAAYEKVPNVATLSDGFVRVVANDMAQQKRAAVTKRKENSGKQWWRGGGVALKVTYLLTHSMVQSPS